jgi:NADH:ubiquinone oxidoreductase subunit 5 (subunit L)/multisubunit Na+/H+ antiporter MnhA subunit
LFIGFVFIISSLAILYREDNMFGDLNIIRFIILVLMFVVSIIFLIISPNVISTMLGWDGLGLVSYLLQASQTTEPDITLPSLQCSPHRKRFKTDYNLQVILSSIT